MQEGYYVIDDHSHGDDSRNHREACIALEEMIAKLSDKIAEQGDKIAKQDELIATFKNEIVEKFHEHVAAIRAEVTKCPDRGAPNQQPPPPQGAPATSFTHGDIAVAIHSRRLYGNHSTQGVMCVACDKQNGADSVHTGSKGHQWCEWCARAGSVNDVNNLSWKIDKNLKSRNMAVCDLKTAEEMNTPVWQ
jgi:hypothetical protein